MVNNAQQSKIRVAGECDVATTTVKKCLKKHELQSYKFLIYQLNEDDPNRRMEYRPIALMKIQTEPV